MKELYWIFWLKNQSTEITLSQKVEQRLITTNIPFKNGPACACRSYLNNRYVSNSCVCDQASLSRSYTCDSPSYTSHYLPIHALMKRLVMETGHVQRRKKRENTPRGSHKSPMTTTTQWYDMEVQGKGNDEIWDDKHN